MFEQFPAIRFLSLLASFSVVAFECLVVSISPTKSESRLAGDLRAIEARASRGRKTIPGAEAIAMTRPRGSMGRRRVLPTETPRSIWVSGFPCAS